MAARLAPEIKIELEGLKELRKEADRIVSDLQGPPMLQAMRDATMLVTRTARQVATVDTGRYRNSIVPAVSTRANVVEGIVGSNLSYAPYVVLGTRPHYPPLAALQVWARRHGISARAVQRAIGRRGTKGDRSLIRGIEENAPRIAQLLGQAVGRVVEGKR